MAAECSFAAWENIVPRENHINLAELIWAKAVSSESEKSVNQYAIVIRYEGGCSEA